MTSEAVSDSADTKRESAATALSPAQKAAIIITALPADDAGTLLNQLGPTHIRAFARAAAELKTVPSATLERVILEFLDSLRHRNLTLGPDVARDILSRIMSPDSVTGIINSATGVERSVWEELSTCLDSDIAAFVGREHPRIGSIVLSRLAPEKAASVLACLDPEAAEPMIARLQRITEVDPHILDTIAESVRNELLGSAGSEAPKPDAVVGAIFDSLSDRTRDPLLKSLEQKSPDFARAVQRRMFLFDDIATRIEARDIPSITRTLDQSALKTALAYSRGRNSPTTDFILSNMSRRLAEQIEEELSEMKQVSARAGEAAEADVVRTIKGMVGRGEIMLVEQEHEDAA